MPPASQRHAGGIVEALVSTFRIGVQQQLGACQILAGLREELVRVFAVRRHSLELAVGEQPVDLRTALIPTHDVSSSLTKGRSRT
jgi:hypothetical protein